MFLCFSCACRKLYWGTILFLRHVGQTQAHTDTLLRLGRYFGEVEMYLLDTGLASLASLMSRSHMTGVWREGLNDGDYIVEGTLFPFPDASAGVNAAAREFRRVVLMHPHYHYRLKICHKVLPREVRVDEARHISLDVLYSTHAHAQRRDKHSSLSPCILTSHILHERLSPTLPSPSLVVSSHSCVCRRCTLLITSDRPGAIMVPVEEGGEGEEAELPGEGLVAGSSTSRGSITRRGEEEREGVVARAAQGAEGVGEQGGGNQRRPSDQGLEKLERANGLLLEGDAGANVDDVRFSCSFLSCGQSRILVVEPNRHDRTMPGLHRYSMRCFFLFV